MSEFGDDALEFLGGVGEWTKIQASDLLGWMKEQIDGAPQKPDLEDEVAEMVARDFMRGGGRTDAMGITMVDFKHVPTDVKYHYYRFQELIWAKNLESVTKTLSEYEREQIKLETEIEAIEKYVEDREDAWIDLQTENLNAKDDWDKAREDYQYYIDNEDEDDIQAGALRGDVAEAEEAYYSSILPENEFRWKYSVNYVDLMDSGAGVHFVEDIRDLIPGYEDGLGELTGGLVGSGLISEYEDKKASNEAARTASKEFADQYDRDIAAAKSP